MNDAMPSATTTTGVFVFCGKSSAPTVSTMPQISANSLSGAQRLRIVGGRLVSGR